MVKKIKALMKPKKFKKGDVNIGLIVLALGVIIAIAVFAYTKTMSDKVASSATSTTNTLNTMNNSIAAPSTS